MDEELESSAEKAGSSAGPEVEAQEKDIVSDYLKELRASEGKGKPSDRQSVASSSDSSSRKSLDSEVESAGEVDFKEQLIGYIRDELHQGFSLGQIHDSLVEQGYDEDEVDFGIAYVKSRFRISDHEHNKQRKKDTDSHHLHLRFYGPVIGIILLSIFLMAVFFTAEDVEQQQELKYKELLPYYRLGLDPNTSQITGSEVLLDRVEPVDLDRAGSIFSSRDDSVFFRNLEPSDIILSISKEVTAYSVAQSGSLSEKVLVEIRARAEHPTESLKIVEVIPKGTLESSESIDVSGGLVIESDPVLQWSFSDVMQDQVLTIRYVIDRPLDSFESYTFPAVQKQVSAPGPTECGNGVCEVGESYLSCCVDCGCLPGFECEENSCVSKPKDECQVDSQCDDLDPSTQDTCEGSPKTCHHTEITECEHGDGFCPSGCVYETDLDCPAPENLTLEVANASQDEGGERFVLNKSLPPWDPAFRCEEDWWCTDGDPCTEDHCDNETNTCYWINITACVDDDGCCPFNCSSVEDDDCG